MGIIFTLTFVFLQLVISFYQIFFLFWSSFAVSLKFAIKDNTNLIRKEVSVILVPESFYLFIVGRFSVIKLSSIKENKIKVL